MNDQFLGLDLKVIIAGCSGGLSIIYALKKPEAWELIAGLIVGGLTANYVAPSAAAVFGLPVLPVAFFVGIAGKFICLFGLACIKARLLAKGQ